MESIVDGENGILTDRDPAKFSRALQLLIEDGETRARYGENARRHVLENWTWEKSVLRLEEQMFSLIEKA